MRSELARHDVRRRLQDVERVRGETIRLRSGQAREDVHVRAVDLESVGPFRGAISDGSSAGSFQRRQAEGDRRPSARARRRPHRADQMRRPAAEHRRHRDPAGDRQIRARPAVARRSAADRSRADDHERRILRPGHPSTVRSKIGPGRRDEPFVLELELRPEQRDLERGRVAVVADERVREAVRHRIHRSGHRHAARLESPASAVLDRGQEAWLDDV